MEMMINDNDLSDDVKRTLIAISETGSSGSGSSSSMKGDDTSSSSSRCKAITFVVAAPDLFTDPTLFDDEIQQGGSSSSRNEAMLRSPQAEFEPDRFREFASTIKEKLAIFSRAEDVPWLDEKNIHLTAFHPLWRDGEEDKLSLKSVAEEDKGKEVDSSSLDGRRVRSKMPFPYPCIAVSAEVRVPER
jgi:hypothetical protein